MSAYTELSNEQLEALPTHRLYQIYKLYRKSDLTCHHDDGYDFSNDTIETHDKCVFIKTLLDKRGHIPHKHENNERHGQTEHSTKAKHNQPNYYSWTERDHEKHIPVGSIKEPEEAVGLEVYKKSKKPFKSKNVYNTVKSVTKNPHTGLVAFNFEEDGSIVDAHLCHLRKQKKG